MSELSVINTFCYSASAARFNDLLVLTCIVMLGRCVRQNELRLEGRSPCGPLPAIWAAACPRAPSCQRPAPAAPALTASGLPSPAERPHAPPSPGTRTACASEDLTITLFQQMSTFMWIQHAISTVLFWTLCIMPDAGCVYENIMPVACAQGRHGRIACTVSALSCPIGLTYRVATDLAQLHGQITQLRCILG